MLRLIITEGTQFDDGYDELMRHTVEVNPESTILEILKDVKKLPLHILNQPYSFQVRDHLYLMHSDTHERLEDEKKLSDYDIQEDGILRIMSAVR
jgi:hypothetical protein